MNLPMTPPTDCLYKFSAIFGLVLVVVGYVLPSTRVSEALRSSSQLAADAVETGARTEALEAKTNDLADQVERAFKRTSGPTTTEASELHRSAMAAEAERLELAAKWKIEDLRGRDLPFEIEEVQDQLRIGHNLVRVGACIAFLGFFFWWLQIQRYNDALLRLEVAQARKKLLEK